MSHAVVAGGALYRFYNDDADTYESIRQTRGEARESGRGVYPTAITGSYTEDYNLIYADTLIRKKIAGESAELPALRAELRLREASMQQPQAMIFWTQAMDTIALLRTKIATIESGVRLRTYDARSRPIIAAYKALQSNIRRVTFDITETVTTAIDEETRQRLILIDTFLELAAEYIAVNVVRYNVGLDNVCSECHAPLDNVAATDEGFQHCPKCGAEHCTIMLVKSSKDIPGVPMPIPDDESIENFMRAIVRYQGLQNDRPADSLYVDLDIYFISRGRPSGADIRALPLTKRGRRGDTDHKMLWSALQATDHSNYFEDTNLIGHVYFGWLLPNISHLVDLMINDYMKTQAVYYTIPIEERCRASSLGTQYRLWRHLQLRAFECYPDEFKIADNPDSLRTHHRLWKRMCEGAGDPNIYYIP